MFFENILNIIKNDGYLLFIGYLALAVFIGSFLYYFYIVNGLRQFRQILHNASEEQNEIGSRLLVIDKNIKEKGFIPKRIRITWDRYYNDYNTNQNEVTLDPFDYFDENQIVLRTGFRKMIEAIPAIFVSLGILGTFWGITSGISEINSTAEVAELQTGINTLLAGMKFAFYSSIAGIVISLAYQLFDRIILYQMLVNETDKLFNELERVIPIEMESSFLNKIVTTQENQLKDMRSFFSDEFIPKLTEGISNTVTQSLEPHLEKSNDIMEKVVSNTTDAQSDALNEMVDSFISSLNEVTGDHIEKLGDALHQTVEWQEKVHSEMSELVKELSNVAETQTEMAKTTIDLSEQMKDHTLTLSDYQESLTTSTTDLNTITEKNTELLSQMETIYSEMLSRHKNDEDEFAQKVENMNITVARMTDLGVSFSDMQDKVISTTDNLIQVADNVDSSVQHNEKLSETLTEQHNISNQWSIKTHELLEDLTYNSSVNENIQINLEELLIKVTEERTTLDAKQSEYNALIENSANELMSFWNENNNLLESNQSQFTELNSVLSNSMNDFADHMHRGVQGTFEQFDVELNKAVSSLARGVSSIETVVESIEHDMDSVNGQISSFNESMEKIIAGVRVNV